MGHECLWFKHILDNTSPSLWLVEKFENEAVDENDPRNWIEVESDNYPLTAPNNQKDIIYDQLGQTLIL